MITLRKEFSRKELLWFGPLFALFGGMIGGFAKWRFGAPELAQWIWIASGLIILTYHLVPPFRKWIFAGWLAAVFPIGWIVSHVLLALVFYLLVFPIGLMMRLFRYDALKRRLNPKAESYWIKRGPARDPQDYFRQF